MVHDAPIYINPVEDKTSFGRSLRFPVAVVFWTPVLVPDLTTTLRVAVAAPQVGLRW